MSEIKEPYSEKKTDLTMVSPERQVENRKVFELLGLTYSGANDFSKQLQKASKLQFDGVIFKTSGSTLSPFKLKTIENHDGIATVIHAQVQQRG